MSALGGNFTPSQHNTINLQQMPPRPSYYITRGNGTYVPLIPADELPFSVRLQGVPRVLNADQIFGLQQVAMLPYTGFTFQLQTEALTHRSSGQPASQGHVREHSNMNIQPYQSHERSREKVVTSQIQTQGRNEPGSVPQHELATNWRKAPTPDSQAVIDAIVGTRSGAEAGARIGYQMKPRLDLPPSGKIPNYDKKEFCTYWIRHGECDYLQQGCLYKHEMPDKAGLLRLGFSSTPRWYLEKTQTVKLGNAKTNGSSSRSSTAWLQSISKNQQHDEAGYEGEVSDSASMSDESTLEEVPAEKPAKIASTDVKPTRHSIDKHEDRKMSFGDDLINFEPLLPTPVSSVTSMKSSSSSDAKSGGAEHWTTIKATETLPGKEKQQANTKVFVPRGESPGFHIARANGKAKRKEPKAARMVRRDTVPPANPSAQQSR